MVKNFSTLIAAGAALAMFTGAAQAAPTTFTFQNPAADKPIGNFTSDGTCRGITVSGADLCTIDDSVGLSYNVNGIDLNVVAFADGIATSLLQDLSPKNSGLGALSDGETSSDDQVQYSSKESLTFDFGTDRILRAIDFNAGADRNCAEPGKEGPCGTFDLIVDGTTLFAGMTALDDMIFTDIIGQVFQIVAAGPSDAGFTIGSITVSEVPIPGAALLLLSGLFGLNFAGRRKAA